MKVLGYQGHWVSNSKSTGLAVIYKLHFQVTDKSNIKTNKKENYKIANLYSLFYLNG